MDNIYSDIPKDLSSEIFEDLIESSNVKIERIISNGHSSPKIGWYDQAQNEWVIILKGEAIITFENDSSVHLKAGGYVNIQAHQKHKVSWTIENTETIWLAVHY
ncbi:cupin domain-containing protein [Pseudoalteromonas denitrificans]|uniref:Cupin 2 domain-containing protein n=1 Tax=Pseudoalteromonas denitrificans DSM 6059 TaxID=1123010 RepID=A0A1I1TWN9_9GAMM|nr:cupin domain-containing protein [Pseudoalteromonas denitrificans]SFD60000.1 cupin 2 domain-containing protein [Pseudoalteromonas denitrificans DSM 6059]